MDDTYEYRHVILPPQISKNMPRGRLLSEKEWRELGVQQSKGWNNYAIHKPEPHILLFRRPLPLSLPDPSSLSDTAPAMLSGHSVTR
jgi:cyclin-dependent kinase regulatory subunit CKS1